MGTKPCIFFIWGAHGAGKTTQVERAEKLHYNRFLPIFGDLYGNKDDPDQKIVTVKELLRFPRPVLIEGKRYTDTAFFRAVETCVKEEHSKLYDFHLIIATSSEEASVQRVNQRRQVRGQSVDWKYEEGRGVYESSRRFLNKLDQLYEENPIVWSMFRVHRLVVEDPAVAWAPIQDLIDENLTQFDNQMSIGESEFPDLYRFWKLRDHILRTKGQEYFDLKLEGESVPYSPPVLKLAEVKEKDPDIEPLVPKPDLPPPKTTSPSSKIVRTPSMILSLRPCQEATRSQISKVKRGMKKAGFEGDDEVLAQQIVGAILAQGIDPVDKGSSWVAVRIRENPHLLGSSPVVASPEPSKETLPPQAVEPLQPKTEDRPKPNENVAVVEVPSETVPLPNVTPIIEVPKLLVEAGIVRLQPTTEPIAEEESRHSGAPKVNLSNLKARLLRTTPTQSIFETVRENCTKEIILEIQRETLVAEEKRNTTVLSGLTLHVEPDNVEGEVSTLEEVENVVVRERAFSDQPPINTFAELPPEEEGEAPTKAQAIGWVIKTPTEIKNGFLEHPNCTSAFLYLMQDLLNNGQLSKRVGLVTRSFRPYSITAADSSDNLIVLPGTMYYEPVRSYIRDNLDWLQGEILMGGLSYRYDKRCHKVYPKASGQIDWSIKGELGKYGRDQISWLRRNLKMDHASRNAVACMWDPDRDLIRCTSHKEQNFQGGDSYVRIPCPLTMSATRDESSRTGDKKALQFIVNWRTMDFTSSAQADFMMCGEIQHWLALTTENRSYNGRLKFDVGSMIFGSHGASQFVYFNNLLKWWESDPRCLDIQGQYPLNHQTKEIAKQQDESGQYLWGQPRQKAPDWFLARWDDFQKCDYHWRKGQWWHLEDAWPKIQYTRWMDWSLCLAIFEMSLIDSLRPEVVRLYGHNKQIQRALNFDKEINDVVAFHFLDKIQGIHHYWATLELCSYYLAKQDYDKLDQLFDRPSVKRSGLWDIILTDALVAQSGTRASKAFIQNRPAVYSQISNHCDVILER
jgi:hypothetical protein